MGSDHALGSFSHYDFTLSYKDLSHLFDLEFLIGKMLKMLLFEV